jgi:hypothetical protein
LWHLAAGAPGQFGFQIFGFCISWARARLETEILDFRFWILDWLAVWDCGWGLDHFRFWILD